MDPTIQLLKLQSSKNKRSTPVILPKSYSSNKHSIPTLSLQKGTKYIIKSYSHDYEFSKVGKSVFFDQYAVELANIDRVLKVTPILGGYLSKQSDQMLRYAIINHGTGGFDAYLQYRFPLCHSYSYIYSRNKNLFNANKKYLDTRIERYEDIDISNRNYILGDKVNKDYKLLSDKISNNAKLDLVISLSLKVNNKIFRPTDHIQRLAAQLYVARNNLKKDGKWLVEIDTLDIEGIGGTIIKHIPTIQMIYIISQCFNKITMFKPLVNNSNSYYLLAEDPIPLAINTELEQIINFKGYFSSIFENIDLGRLIKYINDIREKIKNSKEYIENYKQALIYWDLPGNVDRDSTINGEPITKPYDFSYFRMGQQRTGASYATSVDGDRTAESDGYIGKKMETVNSLRNDDNTSFREQESSYLLQPIALLNTLSKDSMVA